MDGRRTGDPAASGTGGSPSDEELEVRWKEGSAPAFATLFERYYARVHAFAFRFTRDRHLAEDIAQKTFLNLYKKPPAGTGRASFKSLAFTVTRNLAINELKRKGRRPEASLELSPEGPDSQPRPEERVGAAEDARRLDAVLATLPPDEREIVLLREAEGLTFREVCDVTGLSRDAVRWRLSRGMERLREGLGAS